MIALAGAFGGCALAAGAIWFLVARPLDRPPLVGVNYRGAELVRVGGVVTVTVMSVALVVASSLDSGVDATTAAVAAGAAGGFGLLGLFDDLGARSGGGGFGGHIRALVVERRVTSGLLKMLGGGVVAIACAAVLADAAGRSVVSVATARDGVLIALAANLLNLFDRAPARSAKVSLLAAAGIVASVGSEMSGVVAAVAAGSGFGTVPAEVREEMMLGDTGVNALGAALGVAVVAAGSGGAIWTVLVVVAVLNLVSERVSFSSVIDSVAVLRAFDRVGSRYR